MTTEERLKEALDALDRAHKVFGHEMDQRAKEIERLKKGIASGQDSQEVQDALEAATIRGMEMAFEVFPSYEHHLGETVLEFLEEVRIFEVRWNPKRILEDHKRLSNEDPPMAPIFPRPTARYRG